MNEVRPPKLSDEYRWYGEHAALLYSTFKWAILGMCSGLFVGLGTRAFLFALKWATSTVHHVFPSTFPYYYLLPLALPACVYLIRTYAPSAKGHGTEAVIAAVHEQYGRVDWRVAPIKLAATVVTLAFGGSVGKEGPCAQIGAAITSLFADLLKLSNEDRRRLVICGIAGGFAAVFGTPVSGALFGIEVLYLGRIEYTVLFPCVIAGITAHLVCGVSTPLVFGPIGHLSQPALALLSVVFGAACGIVALCLIELMRAMERNLKRFADRPYLVALCGGIVLAVIYRLGGVAAAGLGVKVINSTLQGAVPILAMLFLMKIVTTSITLETGGSGGIITPLFFIGATFGAAFAHVFHLPVGLFAAFGFIAVAAGAANTPIAFSVMGMAILPPALGVYAALSACTAYLLVGHRSVYASQKLGIIKSAALSMDVDVPIGELSHRDMHLQPGSATSKMLRMGRKLRSIPRGSKPVK